jgi:RHS repeat-associated protein
LDYDYGSRGFVTNRSLTVCGTANIDTAYVYEPDSARLQSVSDPYATVEYGYDPHGRPQTQTNSIAGAPSSKTIKTWGFDEYSKLTALSISNTTSKLWGRSYGYNIERITSITNSLDGSHWQYDYDLQGQLTDAAQYSVSNTLLHVEGFDYDAVGNVEIIDIAMPSTGTVVEAGVSEHWNNADDEIASLQKHKTATVFGSVDSTNAVVSLPLHSGVEVDQDGHGNWIAPGIPLHLGTNNTVGIQLKAAVAGQNPSYKLATFEVHPSSTNLQYDANGALLTLPDGGAQASATALGWNAEERLASVCTNSVEIGKYFYDDLGRRIVKIENGQLVLYLYDGLNTIGTAAANGTISEYFTRGFGLFGEVGSLVACRDFSTSTTRLLHSNHRGDVVLATDSSGVVVHEAEYAPFGAELESSGTYVPRFGFSSKEWEASGLIYYGMRYYAPQLCKWLSPDPIDERSDINLYAFCYNNPVNAIDVDGQVVGIIAVLVIAAALLFFNPEMANAPGQGDPQYAPEQVSGMLIDTAIAGGTLCAFTGVKKLAGKYVYKGSSAVFRNGYYEANGMKFSRKYYEKLWSTGRGAPSLKAGEILEAAGKGVPDGYKKGFFRYEAGGWELIYNPKTKEVWHMQPMK